MMLFEQGDIVEVNFDPTVGHGPRKMHPALVTSVGYHNNVLSSLIMVCPITSTVNRHPLHVEIAEGNIVSGCVCIEQLRSIDPADPRRQVRHLEGSLDRETMATVLDGIGAMFGI